LRAASKDVEDIQQNDDRDRNTDQPGEDAFAHGHISLPAGKAVAARKRDGTVAVPERQ
jgi:hypothetical protein